MAGEDQMVLTTTVLADFQPVHMIKIVSIVTEKLLIFGQVLLKLLDLVPIQEIFSTTMSKQE